MNQEKIGKFIKTVRKELDLTQQELADNLGVTNRAVSKWENGLSLPDYSLINDLCKILKITTSELLSGERLEKETTQEKFEENVMKTIKKNKNLKKNNLFLKVTIAVILVIITGFYFSYKSQLLNNAYLYNLKNELSQIKELKFVHEYIDNTVQGNTIYDDTDHYDEYKQKNISYYIPEGFTVTKNIDEGAEEGKVTYIKKNSSGEIVSTIEVEGYYGSMGNNMGLDRRDLVVNYKDAGRILKKYNIHNIVDFVKYFEKNQDVNIFYPIDKIKMFNLIGSNEILNTVDDIVEIHTITSDTFYGYYNIRKASDKSIKEYKESDPDYEDNLYSVSLYLTNKKINNSLYIEYEFEPAAREEQLKELDKFIHSIRIDEETNY